MATFANGKAAERSISLLAESRFMLLSMEYVRAFLQRFARSGSIATQRDGEIKSDLARFHDFR
jgi:hypothetical protein